MNKTKLEKNITNDCKSPIEMDGGTLIRRVITMGTNRIETVSKQSLFTKCTLWNHNRKKTTTTNHQLMALFVLPRYPVIGTMPFK